MWGFNRYGGLVIGLVVIALIFMLLSGRNSPVMLCFCFIPAFPLVLGRRNAFEKRKRGDDASYSDEKPKRDDPRYALGDDGELIELPTEPRDEHTTRRPDELV